MVPGRSSQVHRAAQDSYLEHGGEDVKARAGKGEKKRMSRGLGKVEMLILEFIKAGTRAGGWRDIGDFALTLHPERFKEDGDPKDNRDNPFVLTNSEYQSSLRAVKSLERKNIIESKKQPAMFRRGGGGRQYSKLIKLKC